MTPPMISAGPRKRLPARRPIATPARDSTNVVTPISGTAGSIETSRKAKLMPTASVDAGHDAEQQGYAAVGGLLVLAAVGGLPSHLGADHGQQDEGDPVVDRGEGAAQAAAQQPASSDITAWKTPKVRASASASAGRLLRMVGPLPTATARASAETPRVDGPGSTPGDD